MCEKPGNTCKKRILKLDPINVLVIYQIPRIYLFHLIPKKTRMSQDVQDTRPNRMQIFVMTNLSIIIAMNFSFVSLEQKSMRVSNRKRRLLPVAQAHNKKDFHWFGWRIIPLYTPKPPTRTQIGEKA